MYVCSWCGEIPWLSSIDDLKMEYNAINAFYNEMWNLWQLRHFGVIIFDVAGNKEATFYTNIRGISEVYTTFSSILEDLDSCIEFVINAICALCKKLWFTQSYYFWW